MLLALEATQARKQKRAVDWMRSIGGRVAYDFDHGYFYDHGHGFGLEYTCGNYNQDGNPVLTGPPGPIWFRKLVGLDFFASVIIADLSDTSATDLSRMADLPDLQVLYLRKTGITNLSPISKLTHLQMMDLRNTCVDDEEVARLQEALPNCEVER